MKSLYQKEKELQLYPNPAKTELYYQLPDASNFNKVEIFDALGKLVQSAKVKGSIGAINISNLPAGSYYICFTGKGNSLTQRFVKGEN